MLVVAVLVLIIGSIAGFAYLDHPKKVVVEPCTAGPNERCPSADWMKSYEEFQDAQAKLKGEMESKGITDEQRRLSGWAQDLAKGIPTQEGYSFDEKTKKFTKPVMPPAPAAPVVPSAPPQAKK